MTVSIEPAPAGDAPAIGALHRQAAIQAYAGIFPPDVPAPTVEELAAQWSAMIASQSGEVLVARCHDTGAVVGSVAIMADADVPAGLLLARLYVRPDRWGAGVGSQLHDAAVDVARPRSTALNLWVLEHNRRARTMYERRGWQLVHDRFLANHPPSVRDVLYQLDLTGR